MDQTSQGSATDTSNVNEPSSSTNEQGSSSNKQSLSMNEQSSSTGEEVNLRFKDAVSSVSRSKIIIALGIIIMISGVALGTYLTQKQQTYKSVAKTSLNIIILSPKPGENVTGNVTVRAQTTILQDLDIKQLYAVIKKDNADPETLRISRSGETQVSLSTLLTNLTPGSHTLDIYLYNLSSGKPVLLGQSSVKVIVK